MAENESLDLGSSYAKRWDAAFTAIQNGDPCEKVASKVRKALYGGVRKALNSLQKQCGVCPACVLRRQAMAVAGIAEAEETYKYDFLGSLDGVSRIPSKKLLHLKAFLMQVASLKDVCAGAPLP